MEDMRIVDLYLARNEAAIGYTKEKYGVRLQLLALDIVEDRLTADECENDTYLAAWRSIPPHEPRSYFYAYLARITRHLALNCCRNRKRLKRQAHVAQLSAEMEACIPALDDTAGQLDARELVRTLNDFWRRSTRKSATFLCGATGILTVWRRLQRARASAKAR